MRHHMFLSILISLLLLVSGAYAAEPLPRYIDFEALSPAAPADIEPFLSQGDTYGLWYSKHEEFTDFAVSDRGREGGLCLDLLPAGNPVTSGTRVVGSALLGEVYDVSGTENVQLSFRTLSTSGPSPQSSKCTSMLQVYKREDSGAWTSAFQLCAEHASVSDGWVKSSVNIDTSGVDALELAFQVIATDVTAAQPDVYFRLDDVSLEASGEPVCEYALTPTKLSFPAAGAGKVLAVAAGENCDWTLEANADWISLEGTQGSGAQTVTVKTAANAGNATRSGAVTLLDAAGDPAGSAAVFQSAPVPDDESGVKGWWYSPQEAGTGVSMDIQNDILFLVWYIYTTAGDSVWYAAWLEPAGEDVFSGELRKFSGSAPEEDWTPPSFSRVGDLTVTFSDDSHAEIAWDMDVAFAVPGSRTIEKYMPTLSPGSPDPRGLAGWWVDPDHPATGFFMEARGDTLYLGWYHYRSDSSPVWRTLGGWMDIGGFPAYSETYFGTLQEYENGWSIGGAQKNPSMKPGGDEVEMHFSGSGEDLEISFTWNEIEFNLERYEYDSIP